MKKITTRNLLLFFICFTIFGIVKAQEFITSHPTIDQGDHTCGYAVMDYLNRQYFHSILKDRLSDKEKISVAEILAACKLLDKNAIAIKCQTTDLQEIPKPAILYLNTDHYIVVENFKEGLFTIYDPAAKHLREVGLSYLSQQFSSIAIIFKNGNDYKDLTDNEINSFYGSYMHEYPPPNQTDDGYNRGINGDNVPEGYCRNNSNGVPLLSINPIILNVVARDIPLWYDPGIGPDIALQLVYNGNDQQELSGGLALPTQYFPLGKRWSFNYASFYNQVSADQIILIMTDGKRQKFTYTNGVMVPQHGDFHHSLDRYSVSGGYGYTLTIKGSKLKYKYDNPVHRKLTSIEDRNGNTVTLVYDANSNLSQILDANGRIVQFMLNAQGRITQATDPLGRTAQFTYGFTSNEYLVGITDMGGFTSAINYAQVEVLQQYSPGYHMEPQIVSITTPRGTSTVNWDATGNISPGALSFVFTFTNPKGVSSNVSFEYLSASVGMTKVWDNNGNIYMYQLDLTNNRITNITYPDATASVFYGYDSYGNRSSITKGTYVTDLVYDSRGNITSITDPRNNTTFLVYDEDDNLISVTDPMNRITTMGYDDYNNVISITTPVNSAFFTYLPNGNIDQYTDPNGNETTYNYNSFGYLSTINYPAGNPITFTNDLVGRPVSVNASGMNLNYSYNNLNMVTGISFLDGSSISYSYNFLNLAQVTDRGGRKVYYTYDAMSQLIRSQSPQKDIVYTRDENGNITSVIINGRTTGYKYDFLDRLIEITNPDGSNRMFTYDELGNLVTRLDENRVLTSYSYLVDLLVEIDYDDNTPDVSFSYNDNGELTKMIDGIGTTLYNYNIGGRLVGINGPFSDDLITYTYDDAGNRLSMTLPGFNTYYNYDDLNRLTAVNSSFSSATYQYDPNHNLTKAIYGNGTYTDYNYDGLRQLTSLQNKKSTGEVISGFNYSYDGFSMISEILDHAGNVSSYSYDNAYQLIEEEVNDPSGRILWHNKFTYDNMGNRLISDMNGVKDHYQYNINNQLTSMTKTIISVNGIVSGDSTIKVFVEDIQAKTSYLGNNQVFFEAHHVPLDQTKDTLHLYAKVNDVLAEVDDSARFVCTTKVLPDGTINIYLYGDTASVDPEHVNTVYLTKDLIHYTYDDNGNLTGVISPYDTIIYTYDAENRLTRIDFPDDSNEEYRYDGYGQRVKAFKNGTLQKRYIYDGLFQAIAVKDNSGSALFLTRGLNSGGGIGGLVSTYTSTSGRIYNLYDHRGDIINNVSTGQVVLSYSDYDAFGNVGESTSDQISAFGFSTKEFDESSGLAYFGYRYYAPETGRWLTKDPMKDYGRLNLYNFGNNNPLLLIDPDGDEPISLTIIAVAALGGGLANTAVYVLTTPEEERTLEGGAGAFAGGAVAGGLGVFAMAAGVGVVAAATISAAAGGIGYLTQAAIDPNMDICKDDLAWSMATAAILSPITLIKTVGRLPYKNLITKNSLRVFGNELVMPILEWPFNEVQKRYFSN